MCVQTFESTAVGREWDAHTAHTHQISKAKRERARKSWWTKIFKIQWNVLHSPCVAARYLQLFGSSTWLDLTFGWNILRLFFLLRPTRGVWDWNANTCRMVYIKNGAAAAHHHIAVDTHVDAIRNKTNLRRCRRVHCEFIANTEMNTRHTLNMMSPLAPFPSIAPFTGSFFPSLLIQSA